MGIKSHLAFILLGSANAAFEWAGIFATPNDSYMWTAQKVEGAYVDPSMKLVVLPATTCDHEGLHNLESTGTSAISGTCTDVSSGGVITPSATSSCYRLVFDADAWQTLYQIDATGFSCVAFFAEHVPTEFEATAHYLKDSIGEDVEPIDQLPESTPTTSDIPWGPTILSTLLVNIVTFVGVVFLIPGVRKMHEAYGLAFMAVVSGFAAGALLACAFFLLLFEATHLIGVGWSTEVDILWRWGTMILAGFCLPPLLDNILGLTEPDLANALEGEGKAEEKTEGPQRTKLRLVGGVLLGDFFHNLCDGFFMGAAFRTCDVDFGWKVAIGTILHEIPQELADYVVLTGDAKVRPLIALVLNFLSGLSVLLGAILILSLDIGDEVTGLILCFGGGVYLHLGATDLMPKIYAQGLTKVQRGLAFLAFIVGAVLIGLVLLDHEHCVAEGSSGHGGHGDAHGDAH